MVEKNYDPDNDNCPEKDTVENLHRTKQNTDNIQNAKESINDSPNHLSKDKQKGSEQKK